MRFENDVQTLTRRLLASLDTPFALKVKILMDNEEWDQLAQLWVDPQHYVDSPWGAHRYLRDAQAAAFLKKYPALPTSVDTSAVAEASFWDCEKQCKRTNDYFQRFLDHPVLTDKVDQVAAGIIVKAQRFISRVLGTLPNYLDGRFGPGATFESKTFASRRFGLTAYDKLAFAPTCTLALHPYADHLVWETALAEAWGQAVPDRMIPIVRGNRFTTVPKDATKDRPIAIEPGLNVWAQLAVGSAIRSRLSRRAGINLDTGQALHRTIACRASLNGEWATLDLSSASDTIAKEVVRLLLPEEWYQLLNDLRSPLTQIGGKWVHLEKFSSMGNGFTFELETLLFAGLIAACGGRIGSDSWVYGDDIIVPSMIVEEVKAVLQYFGFSLNAKKSFDTGPFRESCGGDFFCGIPVRPAYLKEVPADPLSWVALHNQLYKAGSIGVPTRSARLYCLNRLPSEVRKCRGPAALGDICITDVNARHRVRASIRYYRTLRVVTRLTRLERYGPGVHMAVALLGLPSWGLAPRGRTAGWRTGWTPYS